MVSAILYQLTRNLSVEEIKAGGFDAYYVDHTTGIWTQAASGAPLLLHITNPKAIRLLICLRTWQQMVQLCKNNNEYLRDVLDSLAYWTPDYQELRNSSVFR